MEDYFKTIIEYININIVNNIIKYRDQITIRRSRFFFSLDCRNDRSATEVRLCLQQTKAFRVYIYIYIFFNFFSLKSSLCGQEVVHININGFTCSASSRRDSFFI